MHVRTLAILFVLPLALAAAPAHGQRVTSGSCWSNGSRISCDRVYDAERSRIAREEAAADRTRERAIENRQRAEERAFENRERVADRARERRFDEADRAEARAREAVVRASARAERETIMRHERTERLRDQAEERAFERRMRARWW